MRHRLNSHEDLQEYLREDAEREYPTLPVEQGLQKQIDMVYDIVKENYRHCNHKNRGLSWALLFLSEKMQENEKATVELVGVVKNMTDIITDNKTHLAVSATRHKMNSSLIMWQMGLIGSLVVLSIGKFFFG